MINENYKPSMKAELQPNDGVIRITAEYLDSLPIFSEADQNYLQNNLEGICICPGIYWLKDTPRVRELLQYKGEENETAESNRHDHRDASECKDS
jgi:hypothetical protein